MQKKWGIILSIINVACLLAVTAVSITVWAAEQKKVSGNGSIKVTVNNGGDNGVIGGGTIDGTISGGIKLNGGSVFQIDGETYNNRGIIIEQVSLARFQQFDIGEINLAADPNGCAYAYIWFTVSNSGEKEMSVNVSVWNAAAEQEYIQSEFADTVSGYISAEIYYVGFGENEFEDIGGIINYMEYYKSVGAPFEVESGITAYSRDYDAGVSVPVGSTQNIIVYYSVSDAFMNIPECEIGIDLEFNAA
jgi:hypothetical protein